MTLRADKQRVNEVRASANRAPAIAHLPGSAGRPMKRRDAALTDSVRPARAAAAAAPTPQHGDKTTPDKNTPDDATSPLVDSSPPFPHTTSAALRVNVSRFLT